MSVIDNLRMLKEGAKYTIKVGKQYAQTKIIKADVKSLKITINGESIIINKPKCHFNRYKDVISLYFHNNVKTPMKYEVLRRSMGLGEIKRLTQGMKGDLTMTINLDLGDKNLAVDYIIDFGFEQYGYSESGANLIYYKGVLIEGELAFNIDDYREVINHVASSL